MCPWITYTIQRLIFCAVKHVDDDIPAKAISGRVWDGREDETFAAAMNSSLRLNTCMQWEKRKHHEDFRKSLRNFQLTFYSFNTERYIRFNFSNKLLKNIKEGDGILQSPESGADHPCCHVAHHLMVPSISCDTLLFSTPTIVSFQATDRYISHIQRLWLCQGNQFS